MPHWRKAGWTRRERTRCRLRWHGTSRLRPRRQGLPCSCRIPHPTCRAVRGMSSGMARFVAAATLLLVPSWALAATDTAGSLITVLLSLVLIFGGFVAVAWFARRYLPGMGAQGAVKVVGTTAVGARERVVTLEVGATWLLLGVGGGNVRLLHTLPRPESVQEHGR